MPQFVYLVDCEINRMQKLEKFLLLRCQRVIKFLWQIVLGKEWGTKIILGKARGQWELGRKRKKRRKNNKKTTWSDKNPFPMLLIQIYAVNIENISCLFLCIMWHIQTSCGLPILLFQSFSDWIFLQKPLTHIFSNFSSRFALCIISDPIQIDGISKRPQKRSKTQQLLEIWGLFGRTRKRNKTRRVV